ncbi:MAG: hypothetical protein EBX41_01145 [Chitinophagia bacterium]|nr:hypothetical protein [Chitinophagia bacterium]
MKKNLNISWGKVLKIFSTLIFSGVCIFAMISAANVERHALLSDIAVDITYPDNYHSFEKEDITKSVIESKNIVAKKSTINTIDLLSMQRTLLQNAWIQNAVCYIDNQKVLRLSITARKPVARLYAKNGSGSYYIDSAFHVMPLTEAPQNVHVVTNVPVIGNDSLGIVLKSRILKVVNTINEDTFWNAQTKQIYFDDQYTFQLSPLAGSQKILLGDTSRLKIKLRNVFYFYLNVIDKVGWDKYQTIDARYKGQIVASPALPAKDNDAKSTVSNINYAMRLITVKSKIDSSMLATQAKKEMNAAKKEQNRLEKRKEEHAKPANKQPAPATLPKSNTPLAQNTNGGKAPQAIKIPKAQEAKPVQVPALKPVAHNVLTLPTNLPLGKAPAAPHKQPKKAVKTTVAKNKQAKPLSKATAKSTKSLGKPLAVSAIPKKSILKSPVAQAIVPHSPGKSTAKPKYEMKKSN